MPAEIINAFCIKLKKKKKKERKLVSIEKNVKFTSGNPISWVDSCNDAVLEEYCICTEKKEGKPRRFSIIIYLWKDNFVHDSNDCKWN